MAIRWTSESTHQGDYFGVPPSGKRIHVEGIDLLHIQNGKIVEV
jgi:predicted ester cyclase